MKTIEVTDEMYDALMSISKEMTTQNHRYTRMPYIIQIQEAVRVPANDGDGDEVFWDSERGLELRDATEIKEWICENVDELELPEDINTFDIINTLNDYDAGEILIENGFSKYYDNIDHVYSNAFFTSKACDDHIAANKHNLHSPVNYLTGLTRNPEMETISKFLCELSGGELHL